MRRTLDLDDREVLRTLLGAGDCHLRKVSDALGVDVVARHDTLHFTGADDAVDRGVRAFMNMLRIVRKSQHLDADDVDRVIEAISAGDEAVPREEPRSKDRPKGENFPRPLGNRVHPQTPGQQAYLDAIRKHDVVFAIGPAGCGKTYLAVASAIEALATNRVHRLILVRPAVEAGERLGFLPGDMIEKVNPYLRPLYDALHDMLTPAQIERYQERGVIEVAPLAFMRGRTLNNAFVILDEAQNTTPKQMKMFLTRLGRDAQTVVTGDVTQVDLPDGEKSGLSHARHVLKDVDGVAFVTLEKQDIVRHALVQRIVDAYDDEEGIRS